MLDTSTLENLASNLSQVKITNCNKICIKFFKIQDSEIYGKDDLESELERLKSKLSEVKIEKFDKK